MLSDFGEEGSFREDDGGGAVVHPAAELADGGKFGFEVLRRTGDEPVAHDVADDVDVRLPAEVFLQRVEHPQAHVAEEHGGQHGVEEAAVSSDDDDVAAGVHLVELARIDRQRHGHADRPHQMAGPRMHQPLVLPLRPVGLQAQTERGQQPDDGHADEAAEVHDRQQGDQQHPPETGQPEVAAKQIDQKCGDAEERQQHREKRHAENERKNAHRPPYPRRWDTGFHGPRA